MISSGVLVGILAMLLGSVSAASPSCVLKGAASSRQPSDCPGTILLIVPPVANNLVAIAVNTLLGRKKMRMRLPFWKRGGGKGDDLGN